MNTILYDYVCEELEDVERDGLKAGNLDSTDKLVNIKKNLLKIEKYESEMDGGYSMGDGYWSLQGSYAGEPMDDGYSNARRGEHWVRGHYSRDGRMMGDGRRMYNRDGGYSYRRRDSRGRYSRADGKEGMMESMKEIMADATTEKEREIIRDAMSKLEKAESGVIPLITERDLDEAIAKCKGERNPTNSTCMKLAAFLTIKDYLYPHYEEPYQQYSYSAPNMEQVETYIQTSGDSEFLKAVDGRKADKVWKLMDELVEAVKVLHPRMYTTFIDKVQDL